MTVLWLTGNSGAGKSTLAFGVRDHFAAIDHSLSGKIIILDGDEMRATVSVDEGFSPEDRRRHNLRVARLAKLLSDQEFLVIVSVIAPFQSVRDELDPICSPSWIYVKKEGLGANDRPYEAPTNPALTIDTDRHSIDEAREALIVTIDQISR